jgi:hypothetical protein
MDTINNVNANRQRRAEWKPNAADQLRSAKHGAAIEMDHKKGQTKGS